MRGDYQTSGIFVTQRHDHFFPRISFIRSTCGGGDFRILSTIVCIASQVKGARSILAVNGGEKMCQMAWLATGSSTTRNFKLRHYRPRRGLVRAF